MKDKNKKALEELKDYGWYFETTEELKQELEDGVKLEGEMVYAEIEFDEDDVITEMYLYSHEPFDVWEKEDDNE